MKARREEPTFSIKLAAIAPGILGLALGCAESKPQAPPSQPAGATVAMPRPDLLWSFDLSDQGVERRTVEELWQIGVKCLLWPARIPEGTDKAAVLERLLEEKYRYVGDHGEGDE